jgi:hypothetical protein
MVFRSLIALLFDTDEFLYQRARRKYREAMARGEKTGMPTLDFSGGGRVRVDVRDIVVTQNFRDQCEAIGRLRATQQTTSPAR